MELSVTEVEIQQHEDEVESILPDVVECETVMMEQESDHNGSPTMDVTNSLSVMPRRLAQNLSRLNYFRSEKFEIDIILQGKSSRSKAEGVDDKVHAHKIILALNSPYFEKLLSSKKKGKVLFHSIKIPSTLLEQIVSFMYCGEYPSITEDNILELLSAAHLLEMDEMLERCQEFISNNITIQALSIPHMLSKNLPSKTVASVMQVLFANFEQFSSSVHFQRLTLNQLEQLIQILLVPTHWTPAESLLKGILNWVLADVMDRQKHFFPLLQNVPLQDIPADLMKESVMALNSIYLKTPAVGVAMAAAPTFKVTVEAPKEDEKSSSTTPRDPLQSPSVTVIEKNSHKKDKEVDLAQSSTAPAATALPHEKTPSPAKSKVDSRKSGPVTRTRSQALSNSQLNVPPPPTAEKSRKKGEGKKRRHGVSPTHEKDSGEVAKKHSLSLPSPTPSMVNDKSAPATISVPKVTESSTKASTPPPPPSKVAEDDVILIESNDRKPKKPRLEPKPPSSVRDNDEQEDPLDPKILTIPTVTPSIPLQTGVKIVKRDLFPPSSAEPPTLEAYYDVGSVVKNISPHNPLMFYFSEYPKHVYNIHAYDFKTQQEVSLLSNAGLERYNFGMALREDSLYVIGGRTDSQDFQGTTGRVGLNSILMYRDFPKLNSEGRIQHVFYPEGCTAKNMEQVLLQPRSNCGVTINKDKIFVMGGHSMNTTPLRSLKTVEMFDSNEQWWTRVSPMLEYREHFGITCYKEQGLIYVAGGLKFSTFPTVLNSVEQYMPDVDSWLRLPPLHTGSIGTRLVASDSLIYALEGGTKNLHERRNTVEAFDPRENIWSVKKQADPIRFFRRGAAAVYLDGKVYSIGGQFDNSSGHPIVEFLDPRNNEWVFEAELAKGGIFNGVAFKNIS